MMLIPGIRAYLYTSQALYVLAENPNMSAIDCIKERYANFYVEVKNN